MLRSVATRVVDNIGLGPLLRPLARGAREQRAYLGRIPHLISRPRQIKAYFAEPGMKGLHLGASDKLLPGWLNTDLEPTGSGATFLDATARFPFSNGVFDFVFCEHFVEHIDRRGAISCFAEVFRCLKRGGVFRVATPDLMKYVGLFAQTRTPEQQTYMEQASMFYGWERSTACHALNHVMYNWGHRFLYTEDELRQDLKSAGFGTVVTAAVGVSAHRPLCNIERHAEFSGVELNRFETMVLEATKAAV